MEQAATSVSKCSGSSASATKRAAGLQRDATNAASAASTRSTRGTRSIRAVVGGLQSRSLRRPNVYVAVVAGDRLQRTSRQRSGGMQTARMQTATPLRGRRRGAGSDVSQRAGPSHMENWADGNDHVAARSELLSQHELHPVADSQQLQAASFVAGPRYRCPVPPCPVPTAPCPPQLGPATPVPQSLIMQRHAGQTRYDRGKRRARRASAPCSRVQSVGL
jgi:hypothetical protein